MIGWRELIILLVIVLLIFGTKRLTSGMRELGKGVREFKKGMQEPEQETPPPQLRSDAAPQPDSREQEHDTPRRDG